MSNDDAIKWLKNYTESLKRRLTHLDKRVEDYDSERKEILYEIKENDNLIRQLEAQ